MLPVFPPGNPQSTLLPVMLTRTITYSRCRKCHGYLFREEIVRPQGRALLLVCQNGHEVYLQGWEGETEVEE